MPNFWSRTLIPTSRQAPADAEVPSHQLMLRAGLIRRLGSGLYDYLPLGVRALHKAMTIVRREMDAAGAAEVLLPSLQPIELWETTGRRTAYGENLFVVKDRHGREQALGPTHEEVVTELVAAYVTSYKQLPLNLYQIQTKFRDEFRPRFGVLRSREFQMKDAYSFHLGLDGDAGLDAEYRNMYETYQRIFKACGLSYEVVEAAAGPIGGDASHEFMSPSPTGEDIIFASDKGNYSANIEKAEIGDRPHDLDQPPAAKLEIINTPNCPGIDDVATFMNAKPSDMLKTLVYEASLDSASDVKKEQADEARRVPGAREYVSDRFFVLAVVRGDHDVNETKLRAAIDKINPDIQTVALMEPHDAERHGFAIGYSGPHKITDSPLTRLVVDPDAAPESGAPESGWITGANKKDHHVKHFNWKRDVVDKITEHEVIVADIRDAVDGDPSPKNDGGKLQSTRGIELGHIFKLGSKYAKALDAAVLDDKNQKQSLVMGCYGIGINRILAAAIENEKGHDDNGIIWPTALAPFAVHIVPIKYDGAVKEAVDQLAIALETAGSPHLNTGGPIDVLIDDRTERPGVKFNDADLIGLPVRITVGDKGLKDGVVEIKTRDGQFDEKVPLANAATKVAELLQRA